MSARFGRFLARLFPSVPPKGRAIVLAAMEVDNETPAPSVGGEAALGAGQTPEGEGTVPSSDYCDSARTPLSPSGPPPCETDLYWRPHSAFASEFTDAYLATRLDRWTQEAQA